MKPQILLSLLAMVLVTFVVACGGGDDKAATVVPTFETAIQSTPTPVPVSGNFRLTILHNNDGESKLTNLGGEFENYGGVARFGAAVEWERAAAEGEERGNSGLILVSSGDNIEAGAAFSAGKRKGVYRDAEALDMLDYDAIGLGNHEFDFGPALLAEFINTVEVSRAPFLAANLDFTDSPQLRELLDEGRIAQSIRLGDMNVGIIGAITPDLGNLSSPRNVIVSRDVAREVQQEVDLLEADGINRIILISHMQDVDADIELLGQLRGVDVVVAGGGNDLLANGCDPVIPGHEDRAGPYPIVASDQSGFPVPVVTTAGAYSYLGKLVVEFDAEGHVVDIDSDASGPIRIALGDNPVELREQILKCKNAPPPSRLQKDLDGVVADVVVDKEPLQRVIAESEVVLDGRRSTIRAEETNLGNFIADALLSQASQLALFFNAELPDVGVQNGGGIRNASEIPVGEIREIDTFGMAPFANFVTVVEGVDRSQFKDFIENGVRTAVEGDFDEFGGMFLQVSGFRFEWSESGRARTFNADGSLDESGTRVRNIVLDSGEVIVRDGVVMPGGDLVIAMPDFTARGGDKAPLGGTRIKPLGLTYQEAIVNYIQFPAANRGLEGVITAEDYPVGGEGRITRLP